jgi:hypothetical protein
MTFKKKKIPEPRELQQNKINKQIGESEVIAGFRSAILPAWASWAH